MQSSHPWFDFIRSNDNEKIIAYCANNDVSSLVNLQDERNACTALHIAVSQNNEQVVRALFSKGANPFLRDIIENTPLDLAATQSRSNMVSLILQHSSHMQGIPENYIQQALRLARSRVSSLKRSTTTIDHIRREIDIIVQSLSKFAHDIGQHDAAQQLDLINSKVQQLNIDQINDNEIDDLDSLLNKLSLK